MNKQELIEYYEKILDYGFLSVAEEKIYTGFVEKLKQLDEPQKVTVPQFVADYIDFKKTYDFHVYGAMRVIEDHHDKRVQEWFYEGNIETFVRAWLDGYEVEKERRYLVKMKGVNDYDCYLNKSLLSKKYFWESKSEIGGCRTKHTRKQLEEDNFGWFFDCEGIEIEEVEDE